jgi:RNA polymerase sigma-70 factor (ECF subfamily)
MVDKDHKDNFFKLYLQSQRRLYAYILMLVPNSSDADDILQQTSSIMWQKFDTYDPDASFGAWAVSIAKYVIFDHHKKKRRSHVIFKGQMLEIIAEKAKASTVDTDERLTLLKACLEKLNSHDRKLMKIRYEQGLKIKDIAERMGRPVQGFYKTMNRIHNLLINCIRRKMLAEEGY